jgi:hypothetical protein
MSLKQRIEKLEKQANPESDELGIVDGIGKTPEEIEKEVKGLHDRGVRDIIILDR